jgi:hypothetical protein
MKPDYFKLIKQCEVPGNGVVLTLYTQRFKYGFRFRRWVKPNFLRGKEP